MNLLTKEVDNKLYKIASSYPVLMFSHLENLSHGNVGDEYYTHLVSLLSAYIQALDISQISQMKVEGTHIKNVLSSARQDELENSSYYKYNEVFPYILPQVMHAIETKTAVYDTKKDTQGYTRSVYLPIQFLETSTHIIAVDIPLNTDHGIIGLEVKHNILDSFFFFLFAFPLIFLSYKSVKLSFQEQKKSIVTMQGLMEKYKNLSCTDPLTSLQNRRAFIESATREVAKAKRHSTDLCILMMDIDHFKKINDTYGHLAGDQVLKEFSQVLNRTFRSHDIIGRYGGEEFVALLSQTSLHTGFDVAERVRKVFEKTSVVLTTALTIPITVSIGLVYINSSQIQNIPEEDILLNAIKEADKALYAAKQSGRNKIYVYDA